MQFSASVSRPSLACKSLGVIMKKKTSYKFYPNLTIIGLSFSGIFFGFYGMYFFSENLFKQFDLNDSGFIQTLLVTLFPLSILALILVNSLKLFTKIYIIEINTDNSVTFRHLTYLSSITVNKKDLYFRKKQKTSPYNDNQASYTVIQNGRTLDLNWLKGRLYLTTKDNRYITILSFGYDEFAKIKEDLNILEITYA